MIELFIAESVTLHVDIGPDILLLEAP
jgi:hypothetical protein